MENRQNLPAGWKWVKLGEVCEVQGGDPAPQDEMYFKEGTIPFVRMQDLGKYHQTDNLHETVDKLNQFAVEHLKLKVFPKDSVLLPRSGSVYTNHRAILGVNACVVSHIAVLICNSTIDPKFLYYFLCTFDMNQISSFTTGLDVISFKDLKEISVPLPPLSEQKRIAAKLKEMMNELDNARTACEKQVEAAKALPSAYLREIFESPEARNWPKKRLSEVCEVQGGDPAPQDEMYFKEGTIPFVRMQDLGKYHQTDNLHETVDKLNQFAVEHLKLKVFPKDSVLLPRSGSVYTNHRAILGVNACVVSHIAVLICNSTIDPKFLYYFLCTFDMNQISSFTTGLDVISFKDLKEISVPLPPLSEQKRIAEYLKEKITQAEKLQAAIEKELATINSLPQSILSKAFRGEL